MKIMLVDDSNTMRKIQRRVLEKLGFSDIAEAGDGQDALRAIQQDRPHLILTDWNMPNMNGLELVQEVRRFDKEVAILMVTTEAGRSRVLQAIEAGVNDYLIKPFTADNLSSKIKKLTGA